MKKSYCLLVGGLSVLGSLLAGPAARAQVFDPNTPATRTPAAILADTTERREVVVTPAAKRQKAAADSAKRTEHMFRAFGYEGIRLTRPGKAALLAAILPGALSGVIRPSVPFPDSRKTAACTSVVLGRTARLLLVQSGTSRA